VVDAAVIFGTPLIVIPDFDDADIDQEFERYWVRQKMTQQFLVGEIDVTTFLDLLDDQGFEIDDYLTEAEQALEICISRGIELLL